MEFSLESLAEPKKRLLLGIILIVFGAIAVFGKDTTSGVTRETCTQVEAVFQECKFHKLDDSLNSNDIYLVFEDYNTDLDIHPSCADDILTEKLFDLRPGTKLRMLVNEQTNNIYELEVRGDIWLDFDTAKAKIENNVELVKYAGYVMLPAGALCVLTAVIALIGKAVKSGRR